MPFNSYQAHDYALAGLEFGTESTHKRITKAAYGTFEFGDPAFGQQGDDERAYMLDKVRVTFSADFVASNTVNGSVAGLAISQVTYATSHAATFAAVVAAIDALAGVSIAASDATARTIDISIPKTKVAASFVVAAGASQASVAYSLTPDRFLIGVVKHVQKAKISEAAGAKFLETESMAVTTDGEIYVETGDAVDSGKPAYLTTSAVWTDNATGTISTPYYYRSTIGAAGLARLLTIGKNA